MQDRIEMAHINIKDRHLRRVTNVTSNINVRLNRIGYLFKFKLKSKGIYKLIIIIIISMKMFI